VVKELDGEQDCEICLEKKEEEGQRGEEEEIESVLCGRGERESLGVEKLDEGESAVCEEKESVVERNLREAKGRENVDE